MLAVRDGFMSVHMFACVPRSLLAAWESNCILLDCIIISLVPIGILDCAFILFSFCFQGYVYIYAFFFVVTYFLLFYYIYIYENSEENYCDQILKKIIVIKLQRKTDYHASQSHYILIHQIECGCYYCDTLSKDVL